MKLHISTIKQILKETENPAEEILKALQEVATTTRSKIIKKMDETLEVANRVKKEEGRIAARIIPLLPDNKRNQ
tara:strand:+ start:552 stop:773 length:222 start_codon:yes stop_codon:yes gene_type:complete